MTAGAGWDDAERRPPRTVLCLIVFQLFVSQRAQEQEEEEEEEEDSMGKRAKPTHDGLALPVSPQSPRLRVR